MRRVLYEKRGRIAYINLNRPEILNAVDDELDDFPIFSFQEVNLDSVTHEAGFDIAALLIWNLVLVVSAFWTFNRTDVR